MTGKLINRKSMGIVQVRGSYRRREARMKVERDSVLCLVT